MKPAQPFATAAIVVAVAAMLGSAGAAWAQVNRTVTPAQRAEARDVAERGVRISELAPNAPDEYVVRRGDTLWGISGRFLRTPWRWPALWGMNRAQIANPHLIYPGQRLWLERADGYARLRVGNREGGAGMPTVRVTPRNRVEALDTAPIPTLPPHLIEPFLAEPLVIDNSTFDNAPRIVAMAEDRVLMSHGDRAYARGTADAPLLLEPGEPTLFRVFREAVPLKDPDTGTVLGYEGQYVGQVRLVRGEGDESGRRDGPDPDNALPIPATVEVLTSKEELRAGDRLVPEPPRQLLSYTPSAPRQQIDGKVISVYGGSAFRYVAQNQIVSINRGSADGVQTGNVFALISAGAETRDKTTATGWSWRGGERIKLPDERNGLLMVFRTFDHVSYVLVLEIQNPVKAGDRITNPH